MEGDRLWIDLPTEHGIHNAAYHNYGSFYGFLLYYGNWKLKLKGGIESMSVLINLSEKHQE